MKNILLHLALVIALFGTTHAQQANLLGRWFDNELIGSNVFNNTYNEIWGVEVNSREFAIIGSTAGTHFIEVTNPASPTLTNFVEGQVNDGQIIHRDFHDHNGYLYVVADEGPSTMQIIDISNIPNTALVVYNSPALISRAHNIYIDANRNLLYAMATNGAATSRIAMRIFSISDPVNPVFVAEYNTFGDITVGHVHDAYVRNGIAFLNCGGDGLLIVDFTDPLIPQLLSSIQVYPDQGYNHSGWLSDDGNYYYMADETHGMRMKVIDVTNPCEPLIVGTFDAGLNDPDAIVHNQIVACDYLYTAYYYDGLQVFDISDREDPAKVLEYDTYSDGNDVSYRGAWGIYPFLPSGVILLSDMQSGLFVFGGVEDGCHEIKEIRDLADRCNTSPPTGLFDQHTKLPLSVYPQPAIAGGQLVLSTALHIDGSVEVVLFDINGKILQVSSGKTLINNKIEISIPVDLPTGLYCLNLHTEQGSSTQLLVITAAD